MIEFAFVLPLLALFAFGAIELGLAWSGRLTVQTAVRAGVRVGSAPGTVATADQVLLLSTGAALNDLGLANVNYVVVFKSTTTDGAVPTACLTGTPHSVSGSCNAYTGAQLPQVVAGTSPGSWFGCGVGSLDLSWCPTSPPGHPGPRQRLPRRVGVGPPSHAHRVLRVDAHHRRPRRHAARAQET